MIIQYLGDTCFKITTKPGGRATEDIIIVTNPAEKNSSIRQADIILSSKPVPVQSFPEAKEGSVVFRTPGEYASHGLILKGVSSFCDSEQGATRGQNTLYTCVVEDLNLCFLGLLGHTLTSDQLEHIGHVDILFLPIDGADTLSPHQADDIIKKIEPAIVIPMHYSTEDSLLGHNSLKPFCDEVGNCPEQPLSKLSIKKKDLEGKSMEIILLEEN